MLVSHEFWQCCWHVMSLNELWLEFRGIVVVKNLLCRLGWTNSWWVWKICCHVNHTSRALQNFVGMSMEKFCIGHGTLITASFCWAHGYGNIFVGYVMLDMDFFCFFNGYDFGHGKFLWLWFWTCRNFFGCDFDLDMEKFSFVVYGYGKFFLVMYGHGKKMLRLFWTWEKKIWLWFWTWEIFWLWFWCWFKLCFVEPQESRQPSDVERHMGDIVSKY